jgi:hypothetical protein
MELSLVVTANSKEEYEVRLTQFLNQLRTVIAFPVFKENNSKSTFPNIQVAIGAKRLKGVDWDIIERALREAQRVVLGVSVFKIVLNDENVSGLTLLCTQDHRKLFNISKIFLSSLAISNCGSHLLTCIMQNEKPKIQLGVFTFKSARIEPESEYEHVITMQKGVKPDKFTLPEHLKSKYLSDIRCSENSEEIIIKLIFGERFTEQLKSYRKFIKLHCMSSIHGTYNPSPFMLITFEDEPGECCGISGLSCRRNFFPQNEERQESTPNLT